MSASAAWRLRSLSARSRRPFPTYAPPHPCPFPFPFPSLHFPSLSSVCGPHGTCTHKKCLCDAGYTGPSCRSQLGFDDTNWEPQPDMSIFTPSLPLPLISMALLLGVGLIVATAYRFWQDRETRGMHRAPFMGWVMGTRGGYKSLDHTMRVDESGGAGGPAGSRGSGGVEMEEAGQWGGVWGGYQEVRPQPRNGNARVLVRE